MLILHSFGVLSLLGGGCYYLHIAVENIVADALDYGDINANGFAYVFQLQIAKDPWDPLAGLVWSRSTRRH